MRPLIGVSMEPSSDPAGERLFKTGHSIDYLLATYSTMIRTAGACPVLIPVGRESAEAHELLGRLDGLLLSGGSDLDPRLWGEDELAPGGLVQPLGADESARSRWEHVLVEGALHLGMPLLGVCRGMQQLNVSLGGSLWQDLERQVGRVGHAGLEDPFQLVHSLRACAPLDHLSSAMDGQWVTSTHHQGLRRLGAGLLVLAAATGEEDVVEAVRHQHHPFMVGVQWHPERMAESALTLAVMDDFQKAVRLRVVERQ